MPVFKEMARLSAKLSQWPSSPGRGTSSRARRVSHAAPAMMGEGARAVDQESLTALSCWKRFKARGVVRLFSFAKVFIGMS